MVASASEESETDSSVSTPLRQPHLPGGTAAAALSQLESLQSKLQDLEEENLALRTEVCRSLGSKLIRSRCWSIISAANWAFLSYPGLSTQKRHHHLWGEGAAASERLCQRAPWVFLEVCKLMFKKKLLQIRHLNLIFGVFVYITRGVRRVQQPDGFVDWRSISEERGAAQTPGGNRSAAFPNSRAATQSEGGGQA